MSNYIPNYPGTAEFEGDKITFEIEPLSNQDFGKLLPFLKKNDEGQMVLAFEDKEKFTETALEIIGRYVVKFEGLKDGRGQPIGLETVVEKAYFSRLAGELFTQVFLASGITEKEEKKSEGPSEQPLPESSPETT